MLALWFFAYIEMRESECCVKVCVLVCVLKKERERVSVGETEQVSSCQIERGSEGERECVCVGLCVCESEQS